MARINKSQQKIIDTLAVLMVISGIDNNVEGAKGIFDNHVSRLSAEDKLIWSTFLITCERIKKETAKKLKEDMANNPEVKNG